MFKVSNLTAKIDNKVLLDQFNLEIHDGEIHVIMGRNGIGKSTLCKLIMGDKSYDIKGGNITYHNKNLLDMQSYEIAREKVMLINQSPLAIEGVTNAELLRTALRETKNEKINIFEFNQKMEDICKALDLDPKFIHKEINVGASGGERKKIELLHIAVLEPTFLILDEIDSGLDVEALKTVCDFINDYHQKNNTSILIITHHPNLIEYIKPNYVHILQDGKIIKTGDYHLAYEVENSGFGANIMVRDDASE